MAPPAVARARIEAWGGMDRVEEQLESGKSQRAIAKEIGVPTMSLWHYLNDNPVNSARAHRAIEFGAEELELQAAAVLEQAKDEILANPELASPLVQLARERAQSYWRMAGVRNRRFIERAPTDVQITLHQRETTALPTAELERIVSQAKATLELLPDGTVGGTSDSGEPG